MLSKKLKSARENSHLTQSEVAKKLYVTRQTVSRWEQGKTLPNIYVIQELSRVYQIPLNELVENTVYKDKEVVKMKKVNYFALFGALIFNICLFSLIFIFCFGFTILALGISLTMIFSPLIFVIFVLTGMQDFSYIQLFLSIIFLAIGLLSLPLIKKIGFTLVEFFKKYLKYNHKSIMY